MLTLEYPDWIPDLLGYQSLIIKVHLEYEDDNWLAYDRQFCLSAAANHNIVWAHIEQTLWSLALSGKAKPADANIVSVLLTNPLSMYGYQNTPHL